MQAYSASVLANWYRLLMLLFVSLYGNVKVIVNTYHDEAIGQNIFKISKISYKVYLKIYLLLGLYMTSTTVLTESWQHKQLT